MHIALLTYHFLPRIGGVEIAVHHLARALTELGVEVSVVVPRQPLGVEVPYRIVPLPSWRGVPRALRAWAALARLHRHRPYELLHAQMLYPAGYDACRFGRWMRVPVVVTPQGADIHLYEPLGYGLRLSRRVERRIQSTVRRAAALTVSSRLMQRELAVLAPEAAQRAFFLPNGTHLQRFQGWDREALRRAFGVSAEEVVFLTVSRLSPVKGLVVLLRAAAHLFQHYPRGWRLWVAGVGTDALRSGQVPAPVELLGEIPLEHDEHGVPLQPPEALVRRFVAADVYVAPALSGGFELSCADALAAGLPLVICHTNGAQDLVEDFGAGLVVPPADERALAAALQRMLQDREGRYQMRCNALRAAQGLDWSVLARRCLELYRSLLSP
ncbi:D-inositol 3-phosphate glycosyltransferase [bacterium HR21]|nr:D-inositol 3-phosphate glycosyltransferase [bacterium HR21]